jgi:hypothetical protein
VLIPSFSAFSITKMHALNIYGYVFVTDSQLCIYLNKAGGLRLRHVFQEGQTTK